MNQTSIVLILLSLVLIRPPASVAQEDSFGAKERSSAYDSRQVELPQLVPTSQMTAETKWLIEALEKAHYNKLSIRDLDSEAFLENYLENLDKQKLFFDREDILNFKKRYEATLLTYLMQGNLFPAFEIYAEYRSKALNRLTAALKTLDSLPRLRGGESDEKNFIVDRKDEPWPLNETELNVIWEDLITHECINEILALMDENETIEKTNELLDARTGESVQKLVKKYMRWNKNILEFEAGDVQELYLTTLTQMFDPHTSFLNIKEKEKFDQAMNNEFVGIGAVLTDADGYCTIKELLPGGPAEASRQLEPEDIILKVAQADGEFVDVVDMKLAKIVDLIKGPLDTVVNLKIRPIKNPSSTKTVKIIRDRIKLTANLASGAVYKLREKDEETLLGVVELPSFYGSNEEGHKATDDVEELINSIKKEPVQGLVLDLRRNGGGYLSEAVNLAGLFISRGPVVQVKSTDGKIRKKFDFNPKLTWDSPLVVLVSRYSASASEIVAGALKNHRRAIIVGDSTTHGKGTVQSLLPMEFPFSSMQSPGKRSAAKITIQKYYLPSGESTQLKGVKSDVSMQSINDFLPIGESDLENALPWDQIAMINFRRPPEEFIYTPEELNFLQTRSLRRQESLEEFKYLEKNISWYKSKRDQKSVSLDMAVRTRQKHEDLNSAKSLNEEFDSLSSLSFEKKDVVLQVVKEQQEKSLLARGVADAETDDSNGTFSKPDNLDIRLHEALRILKDWISVRAMPQLSHNDQAQPVEI